ncbi:MAG: hypothetical protein PW734_03765 [Verrucomicrobium sp.]|nr:hypothetical protein [Verrucomicrobium sp.]
MKSLIFSVLLLLAAAPLLPAQDRAAAPTARPVLTLPLSRGRATVYDLPPAGPPAAILVFVSGGNGWTFWEETLCRHLVRNGLYVLGLDLPAYAAAPYTAENLASDLERIAAAAVPVQRADRVPILYGGVGPGAAQALLAAQPPAPARLMGLLLVNPPARGRCGSGLAERFGMSAGGAGSFSLAAKGAALQDLPVAAAFDRNGWFVETGWIDAGAFPHRLFPFALGWNRFLRVDRDLLKAVDGALDWLLHS